MSCYSAPFQYSKAFLEDYYQLPPPIQKKVDRQLEMLGQNKKHPGLRVKKLNGVDHIWSGRIDQRYRFFFEWSDGVIRLRAIGTHAIYSRP